MTILLSHSTWGMPHVPIDVAVEHCAKVGFDGLALTVRPNWITEGMSLSPAERRRIRALYDDNDLVLCGMSGHQSLVADDPAVHAGNMERLRAYIDLAAEFQDGHEQVPLATTSGGRPEDWDADRNKLVDSLGELTEYAAARSVMLLAEPHVSNVLRTPEQSIWLCEQIGSPCFKLHLDLSHFNCQGLDPETVVRQLVPYTGHSEVKDERGIAPNHEFLVPGEGDCDYVGFLRAMHAAGYEGHIAIEISVMVQARPNYDALATATRSYEVLAKAFEDAGLDRKRG
jgi:sugar phosphate isomerase/epimerase